MTDTVYAGGRITTLDARCPRADAMTVRGERVVVAGSVADCRAAARAGYREVDLDGGWVVPGFTDCHIHLLSYAKAKHSLDLRAAANLGDAQRMLAEYTRGLPDGAWVLGGRYDANAWRLGRELHRDDLDPFCAGHPVALQSHDGHTTWANTLALGAVGITPETPDPPGGRIERAADGPTGLLRETAAYPARGILGEQGSAEELLAEACADLVAHGITSIHDIDGLESNVAYAALRVGGALPVRVHQLISRSGLEAAIEAGHATGDGDSWLSIGPVKLFADGALGSHTAHLSSPYEGRPEDRGVAVLESEELTELALTAARAGVAVAVHAIGDAANTIVLDAVEAVRRHGLAPHLRHRIEHAQHLAWRDLDRFAAASVVASMQPIHCTSDISVAAAMLGERSLASYAWADLIGAGAHVAFGSDAPVETFDPIAGIAAATTRTDAVSGARDPDSLNAVTPLQALRSYTVEAAYASYEEHAKGRLAPGYLADFAVLDEDITDRDVARSGDASVRATVVGGTVRLEIS